MKRIFTIITLLATIMFAGCTDLDDIYSRLDDQKEELANIKSLANAMANKLSVVSYKELDDRSGYELTMSDGSKIILKHGNKGPEGDQGSQGEQGEPGAPGQDGDANLTITETADGIIIEYNGESYILPKLPMMTFTTAAAAGKKITLEIDAAEADRPNIWIDLNNNGTRDDGEAVTKFGSKENYTLGAQTVTIYGEVTRLQCTRDQLTTLDVSGNTGLIELDCSHNRLTELDLSSNEKLELLWCHENQISGKQMAALVSSLPNREGKEAGKFRAIAPGSSGEGNTLTVAQAMVATGKNWPVSTHEGAPYTPPGETPPDIHPLSLVSKWNWSKGEVPDGSGGWKSGGGDHAGYWIHFKESDSGEESDNGAFTYTLVVNELYISTWSWDNVTVVSVTDGELVIEIDDSPVAERHHFTRDASTPPIEIPQDKYKMVLTTNKSVGETIRLWIDAAEADRPDVWVDLNNNGTKDDGEAVTEFDKFVKYTLGAKTVTVYGKVTLLDCFSNQLATLDVSNNTALTELACRWNPLTELDVRNNKKLWRLDCYSNQLTSLDVSNNKELNKLRCSSNQLTSLNVRNNKELEWLDCFSNQLTSLDVSDNKKLWRLDCYENKISGDEMTALVNSLPDRTGKEAGFFMAIAPSSPDEGNILTLAQAAIATGKNWPVRDAEGNPYTPPGDEPADPKMVLTTSKSVGSDIQLWIDAEAGDQAGVWIDLNNNNRKDSGEAVTTFGNYSTYTLFARKVTIHGKVTRLTCFDNNLTELDVSANPWLTSLNCFRNQLATLNLSGARGLEQLFCNDNRLTELDLSTNVNLTQVDCRVNRIKGAGMDKLVNTLPNRAGLEAGMLNLREPASPNERNSITAAQVAVACGKNWSVMGSTGPVPLDVGMMVLTTNKSVGDDLQLEINARPADRAGVWIDLNNNGTKDAGEAVNTFGSTSTWKLASQTVTLYGNVTHLDCSHQEVTVLNTSYNPRLTELYCFHNEITGLELQFNTKLTTLQCGNNRLTELDLWWHDELTRLGCENNRLTSIGITKSTSKLQWLRCYNNRISGGGMTDLVNGLPDRGGKEKGQFIAIAPGSPGEGNSITETQVATAEGKNWSVLNGSGDPYNPGGDTPPGDVLNPLSLVAEYNVNPAGTGFVTSLTDCTGSGYFTYNEAVSKFTQPITIGGKKYHLPSIEEWESIVPKYYSYVRFQDTKSHNNISETVTVQGTSIAMKSDFRTGVNGVSYALRYKGTDLVSAWRYEYISDENNTHMKITSRSLKGQTGVTVEEIAKPAFWSANADDDVTRHFPASGEYWNGSHNKVGTGGYFWSSSLDSVNIAMGKCMTFNDSYACSSNYNYRSYGFSVRLFVSGD